MVLACRKKSERAYIESTKKKISKKRKQLRENNGWGLEQAPNPPWKCAGLKPVPICGFNNIKLELPFASYFFKSNNKNKINSKISK